MPQGVPVREFFMNFIISANTDIGTVKETNQDSLSVKVLNTQQGKMVFAILCDGMGGLAKGEVASATLVTAFSDWALGRLPELCRTPLQDYTIRSEWEQLVVQQNQRIQAYGARLGVSLGTTAVIALLTQTRYYILNVGDSRAYEITDTLRQITSDQTLVAREVALGHITEEQAHTDPRRSVLLQCIGASPQVYPDMFFGQLRKDAVYMFCSDGFRHEITPDEILASFHPARLLSNEDMQNSAINLIELNKQRGERDNISVAMVRTF